MKNKTATVSLILIILALIIISIIMIFSKNKKEQPAKDLSQAQIATFAGGCFWCVEADFEKLPGVLEAISGYAGGKEKNPTYKQVSSGETGHLESVRVYYDDGNTNYRDLVRYFFRHVDPTDADGSFVDRGQQYTSAIFYGSDKEKEIAEEEKRRLEDSGVFKKEIVTAIESLGEFYEAEEYHQDYSNKNPIRYKYYRSGSGRDQFLEDVWKKNDSREVREYLREVNGFDLSQLNPIQYKVTQQDGTEPPYKNEYWDEKRDGIYVDLISGEPLFSSLDKYDSGTGWPSFTRPISKDAVVEKEDKKFFSTWMEIRSSSSDAHLGHVFPDGPEPTGLRYCMNSAALRFVPKEDLEKEGYKEYLKLFK